MKILFLSVAMLLFAQQSYSLDFSECQSECTYAKELMGNENASTDEKVINFCNIECAKYEREGREIDFKAVELEKWRQFLKKRDGGDNPAFHRVVKQRADCQRKCIIKGKTYEQCDANCH